jgi:nucleoside-specific outer membrane channel protein Tsx
MKTGRNTGKTIAAASILAASLSAAGTSAQAATWSDAWVHGQYGTQFAEPGNPKDIAKRILGFSYASGDSLGTNFFNMDVLMSDSSDPEACAAGTSCAAAGAQEIYAVYRRTFSYSQISGNKINWGPINDVLLGMGFDYSSKNTTFAPRVRKFRIGPMLGLNVPGYAKVGLELYKESNHNGFNPYPQGGDVSFKTTYVLAADWGIPFAGGSWKWSGYFDHIGAKGYGTAPETLLSTEIMYDVGKALYSVPNKLWAGVQYQYWRNKFGNPASTVPGAKASTPMVRVEYHF